MTRFSLPSVQRSSLTLLVCAAGLLLVAAGCDFGAARNAVESVSPTISLPTTETTVSGRAVEATSGALLSSVADLHLQGPSSDAVLNMYGDPVSTLPLYNGAVSLGVRERPTPTDPVRFQVVATADEYQTTSEAVQMTTAGTKQFRLHMLSEDPTRQPDGAVGTRRHVDQIGDNGTLQTDLSVETPSGPDGGAMGVTVPTGTVLRQDGRPVDRSLVVDLVHYSVTPRTLEVLPGNGVMMSDDPPRRFSAVGFLNRQLYTSGEGDVSDLLSPNDNPATTWVRLPTDAVDPTSGQPIQEGDQLTLFRFAPTTGTWRSDTTVTVQSLSAKTNPRAGSGSMVGRRTREGSLGIQWPLGRVLQARWWAWGRRSRHACSPNAIMKITPNGQYGNVQVRLRRPGVQYQRSVPMDLLTDDGDLVLSALLGQSSVPRHDDYTLSFQTRDGQSRTVTSVHPCGGTQSVSLPAPTDQSARTDVLVQAAPECPANQHVRITSAPKVMVYYRELGTRGWNTAGSNRITWIMDDPKTPTYMRRAELTLDGLKQGQQYEFTTTYGQDRYETTLQIPHRSAATIKDGRAVVSYDRPLPNICS